MLMAAPECPMFLNTFNNPLAAGCRIRPGDVILNTFKKAWPPTSVGFGLSGSLVEVFDALDPRDGPVDRHLLLPQHAQDLLAVLGQEAHPARLAAQAEPDGDPAE